MPTDVPTDSDELFRETIQRFWILELTIVVHRDGIYVMLRPLQRSFQRIPPERIQNVEIIPYSATSYAGWHWGIRRTPSGDTVYRLRGNRGVEITLPEGEHWFVGSQRPEEFASAIERIRSPNS